MQETAWVYLKYMAYPPLLSTFYFKTVTGRNFSVLLHNLFFRRILGTNILLQCFSAICLQVSSSWILVLPINRIKVLFTRGLFHGKLSAYKSVRLGKFLKHDYMIFFLIRGFFSKNPGFRAMS